ncbi:ABC transporter ATP-binding protein [Miniphocaeibacter massiliensis]|uniref:ABC transporter ATP-binding protein n=1 Tax=Miniphocaeibacter massiliensis TaxID=2041841 RepID=UPI000C1BC1CF|nr:ABC transporter ATP-binding protein [Miniphocaeibacter massiliensis]
MDILKISNISKSYGSNKVIDNMSFSVPENSIFGFIGKNGAGKTTTMKMILGLLKIDSGDIFVDGEKVVFGENKTNKHIGYLPDVPEFYGFMTSLEYLKLCGKITGMNDKDIINKSNELIELVGLKNINKKIKSFSRGMKQRLGIAQALLNSPKLLVCDEPTSALDPIGRKDVLDILYSVKEHTTVLFSTHVLSDVERISDHIVFLNKGKIALNGTLEELKSIKKGEKIEIEFLNSNEAKLFSQIYVDVNKISNTKLIISNKNENEMLEIMKLLYQNNISIQSLEKLEPTLEDLFLEVISK